tara:strand:- start:3919 stop:5790 length:1872 start_codon:yes stop_codon:yes gene_type:complete
MSEIKNFLETATSKNRGVMKQLLEYILVSPDIATIFKEAKLSDSMVRLFKGLNTNQYDKQIETILNQGIFKSKKKEILATLEELKELSKDSITGTAGQLKRIRGIINPISASLREMADEIKTKEEEGKRAELSELRTRFGKRLATSEQKIKAMEQQYGREGGFRDTPKVKKIVDDLKQSISSFREQFLQEERPEETASYASILENKTKYELVTDISNFTESDAEKYTKAVEENLTGIKSKVMRAKDLEGGGIMPAKFYKKNSITLVEGLDYLMKENVGEEWWARAFTLSTTRQVITKNTLISRIYAELVKPLFEKSSDINFNSKLESFLQKLGTDEQNSLDLETIFRAFFRKLRKKVVTKEKTIIRGDKLFDTEYTKSNHIEMIQTAAENYVGLRNKFRKFMKTDYSTELDSLKGIIVNNLQEELGNPPAIDSQFPKTQEYTYKDGTIYDADDEVATLKEIREDEDLTPEIISEIEQFLAVKPATEGGFSAYLQSKSAQKGSIEAYLDSLLEKNRNYNTKNIDNLVGIVIEMSLIMPNDPPFENLEDELLDIFEDDDREDRLEEVENALPKKMNDYTKRIAKGFGLKLKDFIENHPSYRLSDNAKGKLLSAFASSGLIREVSP